MLMTKQALGNSDGEFHAMATDTVSVLRMSSIEPSLKITKVLNLFQLVAMAVRACRQFCDN